MPSQTNLPEGARQLKLLAYEFDDKYGLVFLRVHDLTPDTEPERQFITLAYASTDELVAQFGVHTRGIPKKDVIDFCEKLKNRPWPFTIIIQPTVTMVDTGTIKDLSLKDWKAELERVRSKEWDGTPLNTEQLHLNNEKLLKGHSELDSYPYHELLIKIQEGTL